jgi:hypothetical protein
VVGGELAEILGRAPGGFFVESLHEPVAGASAGVWRVAGDGWSVVLKLLRHGAGGHENWQSGEDENHWYYWRREAAWRCGSRTSPASRAKSGACATTGGRPATSGRPKASSRPGGRCRRTAGAPTNPGFSLPSTVCLAPSATSISTPPTCSPSPAKRSSSTGRSSAPGQSAKGLADAGWRSSPDLVRLGMSATLAAKYAWIGPAVLRAAVEEKEMLNRRPFDDTLRWWAPTVEFLLRQTSQARDLLRRAGG